jgi:hypothetical protein
MTEDINAKAADAQIVDSITVNKCGPDKNGEFWYDVKHKRGTVGFTTRLLGVLDFVLHWGDYK